MLNDENTGYSFDFIEKILEMFEEYSEVLVSKVLSSFKPEGNEVNKFIYFGGEAPILEKLIKESLLKYMIEKAIKNNHFFINDISQDDSK